MKHVTTEIMDIQRDMNDVVLITGQWPARLRSPRAKWKGYRRQTHLDFPLLVQTE